MAREDDIARTPLMGVTEKGEQKDDCDRLRAGAKELIGRGRELFLIERCNDFAACADALAHFAAPASRRKKGGRLRIEREIVHLMAHLAPDLDHVTEASRGDQAEAGALALEHRIGR